jgi:hypothetical protein
VRIAARTGAEQHDAFDQIAVKLIEGGAEAAQDLIIGGGPGRCAERAGLTISRTVKERQRPGGFGLPCELQSHAIPPRPACGERVGVRGLRDSMSTGRCRRALFLSPHVAASDPTRKWPT